MAGPTWDTSLYYADPLMLAIRLETTADDAVMLSTLSRVTTRFIGSIHRTLHKVTDDEYFVSGDGGQIITVPGSPIHGDPVVTIGGVPASGFAVGRRTGMFHRPAGWPAGLENIHVTYTHGYEHIPGDVQDAILETAEAAAHYQAGVESIGTGDENVKFTAALIQGGSTQLWGDVVERYRYDKNGGGE